MRDLNEAWEVLKDAARRADIRRGGSAAAASRQAPAAERARDPNAPLLDRRGGPTAGQAAGAVLDFGIYAGWSLGEIARRDRGYLDWLRDRPEVEAFRVEIDQLINPNGEAEPRAARRGRRR